MSLAGPITLYCLGAFISAMIGAVMLLTPGISDDEDAEKRRGARMILLSPVWPVLAVAGIAFLWSKAKATLKEDR